MEKRITPNRTSRIIFASIFLPLLISLIVLVTIGLFGVNQYIGDETLKNVNIGYLIAGSVGAEIALLGICFFCSKFFYTKRKEVFISGTKEKWYIYVICFAVAVGLLFLASPIVNLFEEGLKKIGFNADNGVSFPLQNWWQILLGIIFMAIVPAICEELVYRGLIIKGLKGFRFVLVVLFSTLLFVFMHGSVWQFFYQTILGLMLSVVVYRTSNIKLSMLMHFASNAAIIVMGAISWKQYGDNEPPVATDAGSIILAVGLFIIAILLIFVMNHILKFKTEKDKFNSKGFSVVGEKQPNKFKVFLNKLKLVELKDDLNITKVYYEEPRRDNSIWFIVAMVASLAMWITNIVITEFTPV